MTSDEAGQGTRSAGDVRRSWQAAVFAWSLLIVTMLVVTAVISFTRVSDLAGTSKAVPLGVSLAWDFTSTAVWIVFLPLIAWGARRVALPDHRPWRAALIHLAASVPISAAHIVAIGVARWLLAGALGGRYDPFWPLRNGFYEYRKDVLTYGALLVFCWTWQAWRDAPQRASAELGLTAQRDAAIDDAGAAPLEVRDGARRHFVRPADIVWAEAAGNYVALHLEGRELLMRSPLAALEARLEAAGFVRIHRSRLVNRACIGSVAATPAGDFTVTLRDGRTLAGSRRYRQAISTLAPA